MSIYRQGEKDQAARIGRLEQYVYDFHGFPPNRDDSGSVTPPPGGGGGGTTPPGGPIVPPPVSGTTPIIANGTIPFIGDAFFLKNIVLSGDNASIQFAETNRGTQGMAGFGTTGTGQWGFGRLDETSNTVGIINETGTEKSSIELQDDGVVVLSDTIKIKDHRPGGSKNTLSLDSADDVSNVGIEFCNNGIPVWELFKTGKNHLQLLVTDPVYGGTVPVFDIDGLGNVSFTKVPSTTSVPKEDTDLVTKKFLELNYSPLSGGGAGGGSPVFEPGKPIVAKDSIEVKGNGSTVIGLTGNLEQYVYGENAAGKKWGVGKTGSTDKDVTFYNDMVTSKTFIQLGDDVITTSPSITIGDGSSEAILIINTDSTSDAHIILARAGAEQSHISDVAGTLEIEAIQDIVFKPKPSGLIKIERGHGVEHVLTTDSGASRPTNNVIIGSQFFDITLGKPVWAKSISPNVWVDAFGKIV